MADGRSVVAVSVRIWVSLEVVVDACGLFVNKTAVEDFVFFFEEGHAGCGRWTGGREQRP